MNTVLELIQHGPGVDYALGWLRQFDTRRLEYVALREHTSPSRPGVSGRCHYPVKDTAWIDKYRIACWVNVTAYPHEIPIRLSPLYKLADGTWPDMPDNTESKGWCKNWTTGKEWIRLIGYEKVFNVDEAWVWIVAHEGYHFLRRERQLRGRNDEIRADQFANDLLAQYRLDPQRPITPAQWKM